MTKQFHFSKGMSDPLFLTSRSRQVPPAWSKSVANRENPFAQWKNRLKWEMWRMGVLEMDSVSILWNQNFWLILTGMPRRFEASFGSWPDPRRQTRNQLAIILIFKPDSLKMAAEYESD
jgi:hypothetical protein